MAAGFKTPVGFSIYLDKNFFVSFAAYAAHNADLEEEKIHPALNKALNRTDLLFEMPRCFSFYLLIFFAFSHGSISFLHSFLCFLAVKLLGCLISRVNLPKPVYSILCLINFPFRIISSKFFFACVFVGSFVLYTHRWTLLLSYFAAFAVFYAIDNVFVPPILGNRMRGKYRIPFYGADFCAFIAFYNELNAYKICSYREFIEDYCRFVNYKIY